MNATYIALRKACASWWKPVQYDVIDEEEAAEAGFAAGAAWEREECAKVAKQFGNVVPCEEYEYCGKLEEVSDEIAAEIRARGKAE